LFSLPIFSPLLSSHYFFFFAFLSFHSSSLCFYRHWNRKYFHCCRMSPLGRQRWLRASGFEFPKRCKQFALPSVAG
jgi:hypothetical protein